MDGVQAHVTLLPPRPLSIAVAQAWECAREVLQSKRSFEIELSSVERFEGTSVLYIDIGEGGAAVHGLHGELNGGVLADTETFEFRPHLTLVGPVPEALIEETQKKAEFIWASCPFSRRFILSEVACIWMDTAKTPGKWVRLFSFTLKRAVGAVTG
jgi:hypothetical protein